jgi:hypothetical protein
MSSVSGLSPAPALAPPARAVACSARRGGPAFSGAVLRLSCRSFSGAVLVASFSSPRVAAAFARAWAGRLPAPVFVRRAPAGAPCWLVSVPVAPPARSPVALPWRGFGGGAARFWRALRFAGC